MVDPYTTHMDGFFCLSSLFIPCKLLGDSGSECRLYGEIHLENWRLRLSNNLDAQGHLGFLILIKLPIWLIASVPVSHSWSFYCPLSFHTLSYFSELLIPNHWHTATLLNPLWNEDEALHCNKSSFVYRSWAWYVASRVQNIIWCCVVPFWYSIVRHRWKDHTLLDEVKIKWRFTECSQRGMCEWLRKTGRRGPFSVFLGEETCWSLDHTHENHTKPDHIAAIYRAEACFILEVKYKSAGTSPSLFSISYHILPSAQVV